MQIKTKQHEKRLYIMLSLGKCTYLRRLSRGRFLCVAVLWGALTPNQKSLHKGEWRCCLASADEHFCTCLALWCQASVALQGQAREEWCGQVIVLSFDPHRPASVQPLVQCAKLDAPSRPSRLDCNKAVGRLVCAHPSHAIAALQRCRN